MLRNRLVIKYLLKENLFSFVLIFSFSCLLFISFDLIELIRRSSTKSIDISILIKMAFLHSHTKFGITFDQAYFRLHESEYRWKNEPEADQAGVAEKYSVIRGSFFVYKDQS